VSTATVGSRKTTNSLVEVPSYSDQLLLCETTNNSCGSNDDLLDGLVLGGSGALDVGLLGGVSAGTGGPAADSPDFLLSHEGSTMQQTSDLLSGMKCVT
jgi:hypothetical protein